MKHNFIEKLLIAIAWITLVGGILLSFLVSKGILESGRDMCGLEAIFTFIAGVFVSIAVWAAIKIVIRMSDKLKDIEKRINDMEQ